MPPLQQKRNVSGNLQSLFQIIGLKQQTIQQSLAGMPP